MEMIHPKFFFELRIQKNIFISTRTLDHVCDKPNERKEKILRILPSARM